MVVAEAAASEASSSGAPCIKSEYPCPSVNGFDVSAAICNVPIGECYGIEPAAHGSKGE